METQKQLTGFPVRALYVPRPVTVHEHTPNYAKIGIRTMRPRIIFLFLFWLFLLPTAFAGIAAVLGGFVSSLLALGMLGFIIYLAIFQKPVIEITPEHIKIEGRVYDMRDVGGFRESADDKYYAQIMKYLNAEVLGLQYGIYAVGTPFILAKLESAKIAIYLTDVIKMMNPEVTKNHERKIQQAEVF